MKHNLVWCDDLAWFKLVRQTLLAEWVINWKRRAGIVEPCKCTSLFADVVDPQEEHISLACSIADEYQQVTELLGSEGFDLDPVLFFRLYLYMLDEFTSRIQECYKLIAGTRPRQPYRISLWANRYAKHKAALFIMHHAIHVFADGHQNMYPLLERTEGEIGGMCLRTGVLPECLFVLNEEWFKKNESPSLALSNKQVVPTIAIPPLKTFLDETMSYLSTFIAEARARPTEALSVPLSLANLSGNGSRDWKDNLWRNTEL